MEMYMKILYLTTPGEDYLSDSVFYGLRMRLGADVVEYPKKDIMYVDQGKPSDQIYGFGFTLWKKLEDIEVDRTDPFADMFEGKFDVVIFSDIFRQQPLFAHFTVFDWFSMTSARFAFLDGSDDGFPTVYDALVRGTYFKRENPFHYPGMKNIGLSIPKNIGLLERPIKTRLFATYVQCPEAYNLEWIKNNCTKDRVFFTEKDYYADLAISKYGVTMRKSGWDVPRHMENAAHYVVNCLYQFSTKHPDVQPKGFVDMQNCVMWDSPEELKEKIDRIEREGLYEALSQGSRDWFETKTCESVADYVLKEI